MNRFVLGFVFIILTSRFFTETLAVAPKALDLLDLAVVPLLVMIALTRDNRRGVDRDTHGSILRLTITFAIICLLSAIVNYDRTSIGPFVLFLFGMLEGPLLFICLNRVIGDKDLFGRQTVRFINVLLIAEMVVVALVSYPRTIATGNPDLMSGTFGNNAYQFTALLIVIGGYFIGRQFSRPSKTWIAVGIQFFVIMTFLLLQYRTAVPAFFIAYALLVVALYGKRFVRLAVIALPIVAITIYGFQKISESTLDLKYEDLVVLGDDLSLVTQYGKYLSYKNTVDMYRDEPAAIFFGTGPGTYVSRANYTFTIEFQDPEKGVGAIISKIFGDKDFFTDVHMRYINPLYNLESLFGSMQINNPNSSLLAVAGETGIPGLIVIALMYGVMIRRSHRWLKHARRERDDVLTPLASALYVGAIYLVLITPIDNYLEIARVTIPVWLLFWTVSTLVRQRREAALAEAAALIDPWPEHQAEPAVMAPAAMVRPGRRPVGARRRVAYTAPPQLERPRRSREVEP